MLGDGKIDAENMRQMKQRMLVTAVGNVLNDGFTRIEAFFGGLLCGLCCSWSSFLLEEN